MSAAGALCAALALVWPVAVRAAGEDESDMSLTVGGVAILELDRSELDFDTTPEQFIAGMTASEATRCRVVTNSEWVLTIAGTASKWAGPADKPVEDVLWRSGGGDYTALSMSPAEVARGEPTAGLDVFLELAVKLRFEQDEPGEYTYRSVHYELTTP